MESWVPTQDQIYNVFICSPRQARLPYISPAFAGSSFKAVSIIHKISIGNTKFTTNYHNVWAHNKDHRHYRRLSRPRCEYNLRLDSSLTDADDIKLEFVRQLSDNSHHRVIAVVRNPEILLQSSILARKNVYVVKGDLSDLESFSVRPDPSWAKMPPLTGIRTLLRKYPKLETGR